MAKLSSNSVSSSASSSSTEPAPNAGATTPTVTVANITFVTDTTAGPPLITPWERPCPVNWYLPASALANSITTLWEVPPQGWFDGNSACLPPSYLVNAKDDIATPTLHPYSPAICPESFTTVVSTYDTSNSQALGLCCSTGYSIASSNGTVAGCQSTIGSNDTITATYFSILVTPSFQLTSQTVLITSGLLNGISVAVAWRPQDTTLFPSTAIPTLNPSLAIGGSGSGLSKNNKIALGVSIGLGVPVLVGLIAGACFLGRKWMKTNGERNNQQPQSYPMGYYEDDEPRTDNRDGEETDVGSPTVSRAAAGGYRAGGQDDTIRNN